MKILNPADNSVAAIVHADTAATVKRKYEMARAAQPAWAWTPLAQRIDAMIGFREQIAARREELAKILTSEVGKPITQSRNELNGVLGRIDFFVNHAAKMLGDEVVYADGEQRIGRSVEGLLDEARCRQPTPHCGCEIRRASGPGPDDHGASRAQLR